MCWRTLKMLSAMPCGIFCGAKICGMQSRRWMCRPIPKRLPRRRHRAPTNQLGHRSVEDQRRDSERRLEMQFIRMTMVVAFVVAALPGFAKDKEAQFKSVEAKHFERAEGVELSPEFTDYLYAELRRSEEHTSELQSRLHLVCRLLLEKKKILILPSITL